MPRSRITQIIAKLIMAGVWPVAVWFGAEAADKGMVLDTVTSIASGIVGLLALVIDLAIHRIETGGLFQEAGNRTPAAQDRKIRQREGRLAPLLALALVPAVLAGCASNPVDRWHQARQTHSQVKEQVLNAHQAGVVSDRELVTMDQLVKTTDDALAAWKKRLPRTPAGSLDPDGELPDDARFYVELVQDTLGRIQARLQQLRKEAPDGQRSGDSRSSAAGNHGVRGRRGPVGLHQRSDRAGRSGWPVHRRAA